MSVTATKPTARERLKEIEAEISALRASRPEAATERDSARETFAGLDEMKADSDEFRAAQAATAKLGEIDDAIADKQGMQVALLKMLGQSDEQIRHDNAPGDNRLAGRGPRGWASAELLAAEGVKTELARISSSAARFGAMKIGEAVSRDDFAADIAPTSNMRRGEYYGVVPQLFRPLRLLDLLPTGTMDGNSLPYTQESGSFAAAETAEGATKPEDGVVYTDATADAQTIAAWMKIKKQALSDYAALQSIIDNRLRYSVLRRLEGQIINGNGTGANLRGILQTSGRGTVTFDAAALLADQVLRGLTTVLLADAEADGILLNPLDWQAILMKKADAAGQDGHYYSGGPFSFTPQVMWGVPLIPSVAVPVGRALVGAFAIGAQLFIREGVQVMFSDSDGTDFLQNRVTLLGEMRGALPVWRPAAFCEVDLAA